MSHTPTLQDAATDLPRTVCASRSPQGFQSTNAREFLEHALAIIDQRKSKLRESLRQDLDKCLQKGLNSNLPPQKRQEQLLTTAMLLK